MLSREPSEIPDAEARTLVADLDPNAKFEKPEPGLLVAHSSVDPAGVESRVAFSRRVGLLIPDGDLGEQELSTLRRGTYRVRVFGDLRDEDQERTIISSIAERVGGKVSLRSPEIEVSVYVSGESGKTYFALTMPEMMRQAVEMNAGRAKLEASGNVTLANVRQVAETGVDFISVGALTHSPKVFDVSFLYIK